MVRIASKVLILAIGLPSVAFSQGNTEVKTDRQIPFSNFASEKALEHLDGKTINIASGSYSSPTTPDQLLRSLTAAPCQAHAKLLFNPGRRGPKPLDMTPFGQVYSEPANVRIKSVYAWIPDNNGFFMSSSSNPASIDIGPVTETETRHTDGTVSRQFRVYGHNQTDRGHYINIHVFFEQLDPKAQCLA